MFFWFLEMSIINSYLLYIMVQEQCSKRPITHKKLTQSFVESAVYERMSISGRMYKARQGRPCSSPPEERLDSEPHFTDGKEKGSRTCVVRKASKLRKETMYYCTTCRKKQFLHPDKCFELKWTTKAKASEEFLHKCTCKCIPELVAAGAYNVLNISSFYCVFFWLESNDLICEVYLLSKKLFSKMWNSK
jgi:hypothetical protein